MKMSRTLAPEHEEHGPAETQAGPQVIEPHRFLHNEDVGEDQQDDGFGNEGHARFLRKESHYFSTRNTSRAARRPLASAPATVPICAPSVASPAKKSAPSTGRASARGARLPPTPM